MFVYRNLQVLVLSCYYNYFFSNLNCIHGFQIISPPIKAISVRGVKWYAASSSISEEPPRQNNDTNNNSNNNNNKNNIIKHGENLKAAIIVPGFLTGADEFQSLVDAMNARGIPTMAVPFPNWHWIPCLGGRSMRPMLERIDHAVQHLCANGGDISAVPKSFDYNIIDCCADFKDNPGGVLEVGGSAEVDNYPIVTPRGNFPPPTQEAKGRIALVGHSAGGWISRIYLSDRNYGGKAYNGSKYVHSLVTLGSPHGNAPGAAFRGVEWCNREPLPSSVRGLAVSGSGFPGNSSGQLTQNAYSFCCDKGTDGSSYDGDGLTPIFSALSFEGGDKMILDGAVTHFPWSDVFGGDIFAPDLSKTCKEQNIPWYGSHTALDQWLSWLEKSW